MNDFYISSLTGSNPTLSGQISVNATTFGAVTQIKISNKEQGGTFITNYLANINYGTTITVTAEGGVNPDKFGTYLVKGNSVFNFVDINQAWYEINVVYITGSNDQDISTSTAAGSTDILEIHTPTLYTVSNTYEKLEIFPNYDLVQDDYNMELTLVPDSSFDVGQIFIIEYKVNSALYSTTNGRRAVILSMNSYYPNNPESTSYTTIETGATGNGGGFITLMLNKIDGRYGLTMLGNTQT